MFRKDDLEVIKIGIAAFRYQSFAFPLAAWLVICNMMTQTIGKTVKASVLAIARQGLFYIPMLFILSPLGVTGLELTQMSADILSFVLALPIGISEIRRMKKLGEAEYKEIDVL